VEVLLGAFLLDPVEDVAQVVHVVGV
jgi:hypothetical protein